MVWRDGGVPGRAGGYEPVAPDCVGCAMRTLDARHHRPALSVLRSNVDEEADEEASPAGLQRGPEAIWTGFYEPSVCLLLYVLPLRVSTSLKSYSLGAR